MVGVSMNRSVIGCVPAFGGVLPRPKVGVVGVSTNWSVTGCVPALGIGIMPQNWHDRQTSGLRTSGLVLPPWSAPHRYTGKTILGHGHQIVAVTGGR